MSLTGRIYSIENLDRSIIYIGSTTLTMDTRWRAHLAGYKRWFRNCGLGCSIYQMFREHGVGEFNIRLISQHDIENRMELRKLEQDAIEAHPNAINTNRAHLSYEALQEVRLAYREANREKLNQASIKWNTENHDRVIERSRSRCTCDCGIVFNRSGKTQHLRSFKHQRWAESQ
jgi:hypothetical protein